MISIIVCSINDSQLDKLVENISKTIGCPYELLIEKNYNNVGLSQVYNSKAVVSKYKYLIFLHDDIVFISNNWGKIIIKNLENEHIGIVGLSGSIYKSHHPGTWSASQKSMYRISGEYYNTSEKYDLNDQNYRVSVVDGCFLAIRKTLFDDYNFDENLQNFHGYDIDISLNVAQHYTNIVIRNIDFIHLSPGNQNIEWLKSTYYVHSKWKNILPHKVEAISKHDQKLADYISLQNVYNVCYNERYSLRVLLKYYLLFVSVYFNFNSFRYTKKTIKYIIGNKLTFKFY